MNNGDQSVPEVPQNETLADKYLESQIEWPEGSNQYFVPVDLFSMIGPVTVGRELRRLSPQPAMDDNYARYVAWITKHSKRLFALLLCGIHPEWKEAIPGLVDDKITDNDLPLDRGRYITTSGNKQYVLCKKDHNGCLKTDHRDCGIKALSKWNFRTIMNFDRAQWSVLAPEFRKVRGNVPSCPHQNLVLNIIMPFIEDNPAKSVSGGFGEVWMVRMHKAHHNLWTSDDEKGPVFAVKRLFSSDEKEFKQECEFVQAMTADENPHPHLMPLLATYKYNEKFHLIFPFAKANLRNYWQSIPMPNWDKDTCLWILRQVCGLVSGLKAIHLFDTQNLTYEAGEVDISRLSTSLRRARINPTVVEKKFGRHGDLKPENILCLQNGTLQIADFGLGRFHRLESRSKVEPRHINGSPTYSPPEMALDGSFVSRAYDIWSLGCILLEFITWLLEGSTGLNEFNSSRTAKAHDGVDDDLYYSVEVDEGGRGVRGHVRKGVVDWIGRLRSLSRHSEMVLDFLNTIEKDMLVIDSDKRISAETLENRMKEILNKGTRNSGYLLGALTTGKK